MKSKKIIWIIITSLIIIGVIGGLTGLFYNSSSNLDSGTKRFEVNQKNSLESNDLSSFVSDNTCKEGLRKIVPNAINMDCGITDWYVGTITYYNGDEKESYLDQDIFENMQISCKCNYKVRSD